MRVLITGAAGYLGRVLARRLLAQPDVDQVVGLDVACPLDLPAGLHAVRLDIRDGAKLGRLMAGLRPTHVVHLAFVLGAGRPRRLAESINLGGTTRLLAAIDACPSVTRLLVASSVSAYGVGQPGAAPRSERAPLTARRFIYASHKRRMEALVERWLQRRGGAAPSTAWLRLCTVVGPSARGHGAVRMFRALPAWPAAFGRDPAIQFLHEQDFGEVCTRLLRRPELTGPLNVAPPGTTTLGTICRALGKPQLPLPYVLLWGALALVGRLAPGLGVDETQAPYLTHPIVVDSTRLQRGLGYCFTYPPLEAFLSAG